MRVFTAFLFISFVVSFNFYAQALLPVPSASAALVAGNHQEDPAEKECRLFQSAYSFARFSVEKDTAHDDWILTVRSYGNVTKLYRAGGRYLSESQYQNKKHYRRVLYVYERKTPDPKAFTKKQIAQIRAYGSAEQRESSPVESTAIFSAIYDGETRTTITSHIQKTTFLGKRTNVHQAIIEPLARVERKIQFLKLTDTKVADFVAKLESADSFSWRAIRDVDARSFHSYGVALDVLPVKWQRKILYWKYERAKSESTWMKIPLSARWAPPPAVIAAFEDEGFIWGGRWIVWDDMHFEYHPELLAAERITDFPEDY